MVAPNFLIWDLGGTNIGLHFIHSDFSISRKSIRTNRADPISQLLGIILEYSQEYDHLSFIIGLPGPFMPLTESLFCPPLDCYLDLRPLYELSLFICNDVISILPVLLASNLLTPDTLVLTVGTSLGAALVTTNLPDNLIFDDVSAWLLNCSSFEIAHISTKYLANPVFISPLPKTLAGVFSVNSLRYILGQSSCLKMNSLGVPYSDPTYHTTSFNHENTSFGVIDKWISNLLLTSLCVLNTQFDISTPISRVVFHGGLIPFLGPDYLEYLSSKKILSSLDDSEELEIFFYH